jgi:hypothetical protein
VLIKKSFSSFNEMIRKLKSLSLVYVWSGMKKLSPNLLNKDCYADYNNPSKHGF